MYIYRPDQMDLVATDILDKLEDLKQIDSLELEIYHAFREQIKEIFEYYDFKFMKTK